jgi:hypothetical protein
MLVGFHVVAAVALTLFALQLHKRSDAFAARQPQMTTKESEILGQVESELDVEKLRAAAIAARVQSRKDWQTVTGMSADIARAAIFLAVWPALMAALLASCLRGLKPLNPKAQPFDPHEPCEGPQSPS